MNIAVRKPNLEILTAEGIPQDFAQVMEYFNKGLETDSLPFIPRKKPITSEEIKKLWVPSLPHNISLVAEANGKVIGSGTVFYQLDSTAYEHAKERLLGTFGMTVDPQHDYQQVGLGILTEIVRELIVSKRKAVSHTDVNFKAEIAIMEELGHRGKIIEDERYCLSGLSGKVFEYFLP